jgi:NADH:ubiquinone oxidoreductase subunit 6 (subunit J)
MPLSIVTGIFLSYCLMGILFKFQFYNGGQFIISVGAITSIIILGVICYMGGKAAEELKTYYKNMVLRTSIICILSIILYFTPTHSLYKIFHRDNPERVRLYMQTYDNPDNKDYQKQYDNYLDSMEKHR